MRLSRLPLLSLVLLLSACGGDFGGLGLGGGAPKETTDTPTPDGGTPSARETFTTTVQPALGNCRTCHVPGGIADRDGGRLFMLSNDPTQDYALFQASWERLGGNNPVSRILLMASGQASHSGGQPWPQGSTIYNNVAQLFACFQDPASCQAGNGTPVVDAGDDLLASAHGGWAVWDACVDQPNDTPLTTDPRALIRPGVGDGKAVAFNAWWQNCHVIKDIDAKDRSMKTCGDLRAAVSRGRALMGVGVDGTGSLFTGGATSGTTVLTANQYNNLWKAWGLSARPDNFDDLVAQRYGASFDPAQANPYPRDTDTAQQRSTGGTGRLPTFFTQLKQDGQWTGNIGITCHGCHSAGMQVAAGQKAPGYGYGAGSALHDYTLFLRDMMIVSGRQAAEAMASPQNYMTYMNGGAPTPYMTSIAMFMNLNRTRGTSNASSINLAYFFQEKPQLDSTWLDLLRSGSTASMDTPAWWNLGHRPAKFIDGIFPTDSARVDLVFYMNPMGLFGDQASKDWAKARAQDTNDYLSTLKSPGWPEDLGTTWKLDRDKARQGAILFHSKDLWAPGLQNPVPKPATGNGSCASCHGAYAQRFVNDARYLKSPALEGVASYITPMAIIGTDAARSNTNNAGVQEAGSRTYFGYPETADLPEGQNCGMQNSTRINPGRAPGYLAPPLYGVWASAPYFHNGAVPDLAGVLDPKLRPALWRRASNPTLPGATDPLQTLSGGLFSLPSSSGAVTQGYDINLSRAYDPARVGWKYESLSCGAAGLTPGVDCMPGATSGKSPWQQITDVLYGNVAGFWNLFYPPIMSDADIEKRKIYNTYNYSQGNQGHAFTTVLTQAEREAIIEYLKTL